MPRRAAISSSCCSPAKRHLRHAEAAEGAEAQLVGVGDPAVRMHVRDAVRAAAHQQRVAEHAGAVVAIGAAVEQQLDLARDQGAVAPGAGLHADRERMARAHDLEVLLARQDQLDRRAAPSSPAARRTGWTCDSILLPKPAPMRGVRQRSRVIGRPSDSQTLACTRKTDWLADHSVIRPAASISASAPHGSSDRCACGLRLVGRPRRRRRTPAQAALDVALAEVGARAEVAARCRRRTP